MLKRLIKKFLSKLNYRIISKNDWSSKVENLIVEASENDLNEFKKIDSISLTSYPNRWSLLQSLNHICENNIEGDIVETGVYKGANLILINSVIDNNFEKLDIDKDFIKKIRSELLIAINSAYNLEDLKHYNKNQFKWSLSVLGSMTNKLSKVQKLNILNNTKKECIFY